VNDSTPGRALQRSFPVPVQDNRRVTDDVDPGLPEPVLPDPVLASASWGREGYRVGEVDAFVVELRTALQRQPPTIAPYEVADRRFKVSRFGRRYALKEVDDFLDLAQARVREVHGEDAVANVEGRAPEPRHFPTGWIYLVALVLVAVMVAFLVTQL
jgi:hypothetical protein